MLCLNNDPTDLYYNALLVSVLPVGSEEWINAGFDLTMCMDLREEMELRAAEFADPDWDMAREYAVAAWVYAVDENDSQDDIPF